MFRITPIQDKELQRKYASMCGADFIEDYFAYAMLDNDSGELMGFAQFEIKGEEGYINNLIHYGEFDFEAMFILGRATMNFIDLCGAHKARAKISAGDEGLMRAIGFKAVNENEYFVDMTGFFDGHCHNNK